jgi:hypothetical protein
MSRQNAHPIWLILFTLLAIAIRWPQASESLWLDELHSAWVAAGPVDEVVARAQIGNQSPLYFYLVKASVAILGFNEIGMRFPSFLAGAALVPLVIVVALRWTDSLPAALVAGLIAAIDHHCVFYAQEARPYALVQLSGLVHVVLFWRLQQAPAVSTRVLVILLTAVLFYLHYTSVLLFAGELVWYAIVRLSGSGASKYSLRYLATDSLIAAVACVPAVPHLLDIAGRRENWSAIVHPPSWTRLVFLFSLKTYVFLPLAGWIVLMLGNRLFRRRASVCEQEIEADAPRSAELDRCTARLRRPTVATAFLFALLLCWFAVPVGLAWLATASETAHLFMVRYLVVTVLAPILLCALLVAACPSGRSRTLLAVIVGVVCIQSSGMIAQWRADGRLIGDRNQGWREAVAFLNAQPDADQWPLFLRSGLLEADDLGAPDDHRLREYCLLPVGGVYRLDSSEWNRVPLPNTNAGKLAVSHLQMIRSTGGAWFLVNGTGRTRRQVRTAALAVISKAGMDGRVAVRRTYGDIEVLGVKVD